MEQPDLSTARFPRVQLAAGHYESIYLKASHPDEPLSIWIRYTVHKRPRQAPLGSLWFTLFDGRAEQPWAVKVTTAEVGADAGELIHVGDARFEQKRVAGTASAEGRDAEWELTFESSEPPFHHLPRDLMYRAPLPRTKLLSPFPDARFTGEVRAGDRVVDITGWRGMVGHNWGA